MAQYVACQCKAHFREEIQFSSLRGERWRKDLQQNMVNVGQTDVTSVGDPETGLGPGVGGCAGVCVLPWLGYKLFGIVHV